MAKMASKGFKQEMPPAGGYNRIEWAKQIPKKKLSGKKYILLCLSVVHNVAHNYGKTATFMPKPLVGDNGSGMHVHQSIFKGGENLFAGDKYGNLSDNALYYVGGILKHAQALNAYANGSTNSYKRCLLML